MSPVNYCWRVCQGTRLNPVLALKASVRRLGRSLFPLGETVKNSGAPGARTVLMFPLVRPPIMAHGGGWVTPAPPGVRNVRPTLAGATVIELVGPEESSFAGANDL